jgi:hypothetical protein
MALTKVTPDVFDTSQPLSFTANVTFTAVASHTANVTFSNTRISANGSIGSAGQVLTSGGSSANVYWSTPNTSFATTGKAIAMAIVFGG